MSDKSKQAVDNARNYTIIVLILLASFFTYIYVVGITLNVSMKGLDGLKKLLQKTFVDQIITIISEIISYWKYWIKYKSSLALSSYD